MSGQKISVRLKGRHQQVPVGTTVLSLLTEQEKREFVAARVNNAVRQLTFPLEVDSTVELLDTHSMDGMRIYRNSLVFLFVKAAKEVLRGCRLHIKHSLSNGLYGEIDFRRPLVERDIRHIEDRMRALVHQDLPFERKKVTKGEAKEIFAQQGLQDKVRLLEFTEREIVTVYSCAGYYDYLSGITVPSTGYLKYFRLRYYLPGFILEFPKRDNPHLIPEYVEQGKLANVYFEAEKWGRNIGVTDAAALNEAGQAGRLGELVRVAEAYHEKQIAGIADEIARNRDRLRVILIAGPSSSGKTTFAQRLAIQMRVNGLHPVAVGLDDYFVDREHTPRDENGELDFEALEAIDLELFNEHLTKLIQGEEVELPTFNFRKGCREWNGRLLKVSAEQPIIIEGIHGLNDKLTGSIPQGRKFKIYVSALTQLNIDDHTRIPTTDVRILRRMVRDYRARSYSAQDTINRWPSVRRGEEKHIFPFQESADVMFNSALVYELAVLKHYAEPLLKGIGPDEVGYSEARRLLRFLSHFYAFPVEKEIPPTSIIREFIGGSCFEH